MHPEIRRAGPGSCPICGMALEPADPTLEGSNPELIEMTRRFWVSAVWSLPLLERNEIRLSVSGVGEIVPAFLGRDVGEDFSDSVAEGVIGSLGGVAQIMLQL